jgi:hypothetical protein
MREHSPKHTLALVLGAIIVYAAASLVLDAVRADDNASSIFVVTIPGGYRQWDLPAPSPEAGCLDEQKATLGNSVAMRGCMQGQVSIPEGAILAKLARKHVKSLEDDVAVGQMQSFIPVPAGRSR